MSTYIFPYNILNHSHTIMNTKITPSFYIVSPHGVGMQSFLYYLWKMGIPSTIWGAPLQSFLMYKRAFKNVGLTIDQRYDDDNTRYNAFNLSDRPIFVLSRDPINLIKSCINQEIGDLILCHVFGDKSESIHNYFNKNIINSIIKRLTGNNYLPIHRFLDWFSKQSKFHILDVTDLYSSNIFNTLKLVNTLLHNKYSFTKENNEIFKIPYNKFSNRKFRFTNPLTLKHDSIELDIMFIPSFLTDFYINYNRSGIKLCSHVYNSTEYTLFYSVKKESESAIIETLSIPRSTIDQYISTSLNKHVVAEELYNNLCLTTDSLCKKLKQIDNSILMNFIDESKTSYDILNTLSDKPIYWNDFFNFIEYCKA